VLGEDDRAIVGAASAASKASEFLLAFGPNAGSASAGPVTEDKREAA
jgi:antirestriction protein ArdC